MPKNWNKVRKSILVPYLMLLYTLMIQDIDSLSIYFEITL